MPYCPTALSDQFEAPENRQRILLVKNMDIFKTGSLMPADTAETKLLPLCACLNIKQYSSKGARKHQAHYSHIKKLSYG